MSFNRNKRRLALDLKQPAAVEAVRRMAARAGAVVEVFRPGVVAKLGVELVVQALSGLMRQIGLEGAEPCKARVPAVDLTTGFLGTMAVPGALRDRNRTGRGPFLDLSRFNASLMPQASGIASYLASGEVPKRIGSAAPCSAPNEAYRTADDVTGDEVGAGKVVTRGRDDRQGDRTRRPDADRRGACGRPGDPAAAREAARRAAAIGCHRRGRQRAARLRAAHNAQARLDAIAHRVPFADLMTRRDALIAGGVRGRGVVVFD